MREDRRVVTALFADITGSTGLTERLREDEAQLVVGDAIARIVLEVERLGGYVKDLAGDGVLALFGAPTSYEDDAERAARAALNILQSIAAYGEEVARSWAGERIAVRIGISTGLVALGPVGAGHRVEYAAFGDTVITAARLQGLAEPGSALVDPATQHRLARLFEWGTPQSVQLKGRSDKTVAVPLGPARPMTSRLRAAAHAAPDLVGRDVELSMFRSALDDVSAGAGGVVLVTGEAGVGKSRLVASARELTEDQPVAPAPLWLEGRCLSYADQLPNFPFRDLLREWLGVDEGDTELRIRISLRSTVDRLFDRTDDVVPYLDSLLGLTHDGGPADSRGLEAEELQRRMFAAVSRLFERLARDRPVVIVLEDLHWADATSIQLLRHLVPTVDRAAVLFVLTHRDERDSAAWGVKEAIVRDFPHAARDIALEPLPADAERVLLEALVGTALTDELVQRITDAAEGNPLYLEELVRSLSDAGALVRGADGAWQLDPAVPITIPETVGKVILARADRLPPDSHAVLVAASVIGRRFDRQLLSAVVGPDVDLVQRLPDLQRLGFITLDRRWPQERYRFRHALIQEAVSGTILPAHRAQLHRLAAESLEQNPSETQEHMLTLARHWDQAGEPARAIPYYRRGAELALPMFANEEAADALTRAMDLLEQTPAGSERDEDELELRTLRGIAGWGTEGLGAASVVADFERAKQLSGKLQTEVSPSILRGQAINSVVRLDLADTRENGLALLAAAQRAHDPLLLVEAEYVLGVAAFWEGELADSRQHLEAAIDAYSPERHEAHVVQFSQDPKVVCLVRLAWTLWHLGHWRQARTMGDAALDLAVQLAHPASRIYAAAFAGFLTSDLGDDVRFDRALTLLSTEHIRGVWEGAYQVLRQRDRLLRGDPAALASVEAIIETSHRKQQLVYNNIARCLVARGHLAAEQPRAATTVLNAALAEVANTGARYIEAELHRLIGEALAAEGADVEGVASAFRTAHAVAADQQARSFQLRAATSWVGWAAGQPVASALKEPRELLVQVSETFHGLDADETDPDLLAARRLLNETS